MTSVATVTVTPYELALREPFVTALRSVTAVGGVVVALRDTDGRVGIGEAVPTPQITGETRASIVAAVGGPLGDAVVGRRVDEIDAALEGMSRAIVGNASAKAAVDVAFHDLWARSLDAPLHRLLGGARKELVTDVTVSLAPPDVMADAASRRVDDGFSVLKVKLGGPAALDLARVAAVRARVGDLVRIRVDANQSWDAKGSVALIRRFEDAGLGIELVEQPVPARDLDALAYVTASVETPVMADESCFSPADVVELVRRRAADAINVKLMKSGGIRPALAMLAAARAAGIECSVGSMMEANISATAAACLAAGRVEVTSVDLDAPWWLAGVVAAGGATFEAGRVALGDGPGLGHTDLERFAGP